jgi:murein L,D-transpeptidase YcbB/YkuD
MVIGLITQAVACLDNKTNQSRDETISEEITKQLTKGHLPLYYPRSVKRFYQRNKFAAVWMKPQSGQGPAWQGMLMIDCVLQFGLLHDDYHPGELTYPKLHKLLDLPNKEDIKAQARFEIMLTDAMITFINNLHFGKLNTDYPVRRLDKMEHGSFVAADFLAKALVHQDIVTALSAAQPKMKTYIDLQNHMKLLTGQRQTDCYEVPENDIKKMAINMERIRWITTTGKLTHLTCVIQEGVMVNYQDVDQQDKNLEIALYKPMKLQ